MLKPFDIDRAIKDTRACNDIVNFNHACAALMSIPVADTLHAYLRKEGRHDGYEAGDRGMESLNIV